MIDYRQLTDHKLTDEYAAKETADKICNLLRDYIPEACFRNAHALVVETAYKEGFELTSKLMRKEYEAWKSLEIKGLGFANISKEIKE